MLRLANEKKTDKKLKQDAAAAKKNTQPISNFFNVKKQIVKQEKVKIDDSIEDFIVGTNTSLQTIENPLFRKMLFSLHSG